MKILQLTKHYPPYNGGIESVTFDITEGINLSGHACDVLCANDKRNTVIDYIKGYVVYRVSSWGKVFSTSIAPMLIWYLWKLKHKYDVIHVHFPDPMSAIALLLANPKSKLIVHWHSDIVKQKKILKIYQPLQNFLLRKADAIICTSPAYLEGSAQLKAFKSKAIVIPIGIRKNVFPISDKKIGEIQQQYDGKKIIFSLGRLVYYKGFEFLIESAKHLPEDMLILIGGSGELAQALNHKIQTENLAHKVKLLGKISYGEIGSYYKACHLFCLPSIERSEAFGVVQIEAMSFGKPVVATKIENSGVSWVNEHEVSGVNVLPKDAPALANAIIAILNNTVIYEKLSAGATERFSLLFTADKMVAGVMSLYKKLCCQE